MHATHYAYRYRISGVKKVRGTCVKGPRSDFESFNFEYHARDYVANRIASASMDLFLLKLHYPVSFISLFPIFSIFRYVHILF